MKYWILDEDTTPQGFPLRMLILLILKQIASTTYQLWILRSQGYGLRVNEWDERLDKEEQLLIDPELLLDTSVGEEEWFYDLDAKIITDGLEIRFGLHDSTALYLEAPQDFSKKIIKSFKLVKTNNTTGAGNPQ